VVVPSLLCRVFRARGDVHRHQSRGAKRARQRALRAHVLDYLREHPCADCAASDPVVLEFDHIGQKTASISDLISVTATIRVIDAEIDQCEVVCANCHRRRTAARAGWRRGRVDQQSNRGYVSAPVARNLGHLYAILAEAGCVDCGLQDPIVLEFDHVGRKRAAVTTLAWHACSLATIDAEIRECEIRCANCHRRVTAARGDHFRLRVLSSSVPL
jgi:hypothetical protein